ncbi:MAG: hypothetical protein WBM56_05895, partial [Robiginitalea sp.]|uniref:hypothetical protein n=1 Tax=Robiginitalea sp. TaxID=1902411 RepID=UPI003C741ABC
GVTVAVGGISSDIDGCDFLQESAKIVYSTTMTSLRRQFIELVIDLHIDLNEFKDNDYARRFNGHDG